MADGFKFSEFVTDKKLEEEGVWIEYAQGFSMLVARLGNSKCQSYLRKLRKPYTRQIQKGTLSDEVAQDLLKKAISKYVLLDWKGLIEDNGKSIPYSEEKALELLSHRDFLEAVTDLAMDQELFKQEAEGTIEKN